MLYSQGRSEMDTIPREPDHWGVPQTPNNVSSTFFNTVHHLQIPQVRTQASKLLLAPGTI